MTTGSPQQNFSSIHRASSAPMKMHTWEATGVAWEWSMGRVGASAVDLEGHSDLGSEPFPCISGSILLEAHQLHLKSFHLSLGDEPS